MPPSASLQSRIEAFEALSSGKTNGSRSPSHSHVSQTSLIDLGDWILEDGFNRAPETNSSTPSPTATPLINFESPPNQRPPLPPRKHAEHSIAETSTTLLAIEHTYPPGPHKFGTARLGHASASSISSFHSVSLSSDGSHVKVHTDKPPSIILDVDGSTDSASIADSFENVSAVSPSTTLSFDWTPNSRSSPKHDPPGIPNRPTKKVAPVVPPKPVVRSVSTSSSSTTTTTKTRRPPPPPPPYQPRSRPSSSRASVVSTSASTSDRSSILSNATTTSRTSISTRNSAQFSGSAKSSPLMRPTPVPPAARLRYESLFDSAVQGRRKVEKKAQKTKPLSSPPPSAKKSRQAAGWRGLSVDLITSPEDHPVLSCEKRKEESDSEDEQEASPVTSEEKLNGRIVKHIWCASRLDHQKLRSIWTECDPECTGLIDRDTFVKGMWRIDEELRRAQLARRTSALSAASTQRIPHRPLLPPRPSQGAARLLI